MSTKLANLIVKNEDSGEAQEVDRKSYLKIVEATHQVVDYIIEGQNPTTAPNVVKYVLETLEKGQELDEGLASTYPELVSQMTADVKFTKDNAKSAAEKAQEKKDAKEKEKAETEAKTKAAEAEGLVVKTEFVKAVVEGFDLAAAEFDQELKDLQASLPEGVTLEAKGAGSALIFGKDTTKETIGQVFGYLQQKSANSSFLNNQMQFWMGDTISACTDRKIFETAGEAQKFIAAEIEKMTGKAYQPASLGQYKLMAERTPVEKRNVKADMSAYLRIAGMKLPKQGDKESNDDFTNRNKAFIEERGQLQDKLASGELKSKKEIDPLADAVLIKHGLKEAPVEPGVSLTTLYTRFFHASQAQKLVGLVEPDVAIYMVDGKVAKLTKEQTEAVLADTEAQLVNILFRDDKAGITPKDFFRGYVNKTEEVQVGVQDNDEKTPIMQEKTSKVNVYPKATWFAPPATEADPASKSSSSAETPAEEPELAEATA